MFQDFCYALVKAEMDTDFEEDCKEIIDRRKKLTEELKQSKGQDHAEGLNDSNCLDTSQRKRKAKRKASNWSKGNAASRKRSRRQTENENGDHNHEQADEMDMNGDVMEDEESSNQTPPQSTSRHEEPIAVTIDKTKLDHLLTDLVNCTEGYTVSKLERIFSQMMDSVLSYKLIPDRSSLPKELQCKIQSIKAANKSPKK